MEPKDAAAAGSDIFETGIRVYASLFDAVNNFYSGMAWCGSRLFFFFESNFYIVNTE